PWVAGIIVIGGICAVATWIIGPTKGLFAAADDGLIPSKLGKVNRFGAPLPILLLQGAICSMLCLVYLLLPSVKSAYWFLSAMAAQLAFFMYAILFISAIRLRYVSPQQRAFKIPGGNIGMWLLAGMGFVVSLFVIALGFIPPSDVDVGSVWWYETLLIGGDLSILLPVFFLGRKHKLQIDAFQPA
ncbi:MAG TPA: amino acid permease, partial [Gammaproteobacteria bacterium]|nr:amino acid permease [Gammaproteobacteria bacterium]